MTSDVLAHFGVTAAARLGGGGEADVYALPANRVMRLMKPGAEMASETRRLALLDRLAQSKSGLAFDLPVILDHGVQGGRIFSIEERIPGVGMDQALANKAKDRTALVQNYMVAAQELGRLSISEEFGELAGPEPLVADDQAAALAAIAARSLRQAGLGFDAGELADGLPNSGRPGLFHVDFFPGNVMCDGATVTGVIDFGYSTLSADPRLTAIVAGACLHTRITANATAQDQAVADQWLEQNGLCAFTEPTNRWLAAYWAFAFKDDRSLEIWGRAQLGL